MAAPLAIRTNTGAIAAHSRMARAGREVTSSVKRLSSGLRIQSAAEDAAGIAVRENLRARHRSVHQAIRNANDAVALLQTLDGAYQTISDILNEMVELAVQSANDSLSDTERAFVDAEFQEHLAGIDRIADMVEMNGRHLAQVTTTLTFQIGIDNSTNDRLVVTLDGMTTNHLGVMLDSVDSLVGAQGAITSLEASRDYLDVRRAQVGAHINNLDGVVDHLSRGSERLGASLGQLQDTDMASESANFARHTVLQEAGAAMIAQANALPSLALSLLG